MLNLFKNFGKGILYVLVLPFLLVGLAIYAVVAIFIFIYLAIKGLILFFTGRSLYEDLPEDKEAKRRIALANGVPLEEASNIDEEPSEPEPEQKQDDIDNDPFYVPHYLKDEVQIEEPAEPEQEPEPEPEQYYDEPVQQEQAAFEEPISEPEPEAEEPQEIEEIPSKSSQNSAFLEINEEDDSDSDDDGISIKYE